MSATITQLFPLTPVGHFLRLGHTGHRQLEILHEAGRVAAKRVVVDAAHAVEQKELIDSFRSAGAEIVIDTRMAELATPGGYLTSAKKLPWAHPTRAYSIDDFTPTRIREVAAKVAEFAVALVDRVARKSLRIRIGDEKIEEKLKENSKRTDDMRHVLEELHATDLNPSRSRALELRVRRASGVARDSRSR